MIGFLADGATGRGTGLFPIVGDLPDLVNDWVAVFELRDYRGGLRGEEWMSELLGLQAG